MLAVNTALALARRGLSVAIADLDFHHGQVAAHLNTPIVHTTADLVHALTGEDDDDREALGDAVVAHESGLLVYGAPARPDQASATSADDVIELARALRLTHPLVVIDAGSVPGTRALALLGLADESVIVVSPDIPGLRALTGTLAAMTDSGIVGEQNRFVVNRTFAAQQIDRRDIEQHLGVSVSLEIPFDGESCLRAVNEGQPVLTLNPRSPVSAAIENLATMLIGAATPATADAEPVRRRSRVGALLRRR
jgi:pilus assembly protein CpaE